MLNNNLAHAIALMIQNDDNTSITTTGAWGGGVNVIFTSPTIFTDEKLTFGVDEDEWQGGPVAAVANFLATAVEHGDITFKPISEK